MRLTSAFTEWNRSSRSLLCCLSPRIRKEREGNKAEICNSKIDLAMTMTTTSSSSTSGRVALAAVFGVDHRLAINVNPELTSGTLCPVAFATCQAGSDLGFVKTALPLGDENKRMELCRPGLRAGFPYEPARALEQCRHTRGRGKLVGSPGKTVPLGQTWMIEALFVCVKLPNLVDKVEPGMVRFSDSRDSQQLLRGSPPGNARPRLFCTSGMYISCSMTTWNGREWSGPKE